MVIVYVVMSQRSWDIEVRFLSITPNIIWAGGNDGGVATDCKSVLLRVNNGGSNPPLPTNTKYWFGLKN